MGAIDAGASSSRLNKTPVSSPRDQPRFLVVGEILKPHGVRGELRMRVLTDNPDHLPQLDSIHLGDSADDADLREFALNRVRFNKAYALLSLEGCRNRNDADLLRGKTVLIGRDQAAPLEDGEYYLYQLIGLKVIADQTDIGRVKEVLQTGANDVYIVDSEAYGDLLIPAHDETILSIDFDAETINMALPDGLLPAR